VYVTRFFHSNDVSSESVHSPTTPENSEELDAKLNHAYEKMKAAAGKYDDFFGECELFS
jgi:hypothetical protein